MSETNKPEIQIPEDQSKYFGEGLDKVDVDYWNYSVSRPTL